MNYALIKTGIVANIIVADAAFAEAIATDWDAVVLMPEGAGIGWGWNGKKFKNLNLPTTAPVDSRPIVVVTSITVDADHQANTDVSADLRSVDAPVGATLTFLVELRAGNTVLPVTKRFRMPLRSADAVAASRLIAVDFVHGRATFHIALTASCHWCVDEAAINENLGPNERLSFSGLDVYALELS